MWVVDWVDDKVYAYLTGSRAWDPAGDFDTLRRAGNRDPEGMWSDGTTMWVADSYDDKIFAYDLATKARVPGRDFDTLGAARNNDPRGIWSDGETMWVVDIYRGNTLRQQDFRLRSGDQGPCPRQGIP